MDITVSWNITAISFSLSAALAAFIAWRGYLVWQEDRRNRISESFFKAFIAFTLYTGVRAVASVFFPHNPDVLSAVYILSHVFQGVAAAYIIRLAVSVFNTVLAERVFLAVASLYIIKAGFNLILPSNPQFNPQLNVIEWGQDPLVGILHTALVSSVSAAAAGVFLFHAIQNRSNAFLRTRSLLMASAIVMAILVVIPRNVFQAPAFIFLSDLGFILAFGLMLWAITIRKKLKEPIPRAQE